MNLAYEDHFIELPDVMGEAIVARYWDEGDTDKPVLLFLHGIGDSLEMCLSTIDYFAREYRFIAVDLVGHGKSSLAHNKQVYSTKGFTTFLLRFIETMGLPTPLYIFAHSLGGILATRFSLEHTELVRKLVMVSPGGFNAHVALKFRLGSLPLVGRLSFTPFVLNRIRASALAKFPNNEYISKELIDLKYDYQLYHSKDAILTLLQNEVHFKQGFTRSFTHAELQSLDIPTLIFWGNQDTTVPTEQYHDAMRGLKNCRIVLFEGVGHRALMSRADHVNAMSAQFLTDGHLDDEVEQNQPYQFS